MLHLTLIAKVCLLPQVFQRMVEQIEGPLDLFLLAMVLSFTSRFTASTRSPFYRTRKSLIP
jgi:hypothetical protein